MSPRDKPATHELWQVLEMALSSQHHLRARTGSVGTFRNMLQDRIRQLAASDFVRKVAETYATQIVLIGLGLLTSVTVARSLGPQGRGFYAVAMAMGLTGVQLGNLGLHASNTYYVAQNRSLLPTLVGDSFLI